MAMTKSKRSSRITAMLSTIWSGKDEEGMKLDELKKLIESMDKGPFIMNGDRIDSDDFTRDASLIAYGDFASKDDKEAYLEPICAALNNIRALIEVAEAAKKLYGYAEPPRCTTQTTYWNVVSELRAALSRLKEGKG